MSALRYVVLRHDGIPDPHYDVMWETAPGSALTTVRCDEWPVLDTTGVQPIHDHRREYLEYEGPISGGRGRVRRVASGTCELELGAQDTAFVRFDNGMTLSIPRPRGA